MDIGYILFNSLVYGLVAFILMSFFAYFKILNFSVGALIMYIAYAIHYAYQGGSRESSLAIIGSIILFYMLVNYILLKYFKNIKQRELFGLVFTLGGSILIENVANYIFGSNAISMGSWHISSTVMIVIFLVLNVLIFYVLKSTLLGKLFKGIFENAKVIKSLGFATDRALQIYGLVLLGIMTLLAAILLAKGTIRPSDALFYMIKGIGIMILVGMKKIEYVLVGALIYVCIEYILFIKIGLPTSYKETMILLVMLLVLIFKPNGLFTRKALRKS